MYMYRQRAAILFHHKVLKTSPLVGLQNVITCNYKNKKIILRVGVMSIDPVSHGVLGQGCESETLIIRTNRGF